MSHIQFCGVGLGVDGVGVACGRGVDFGTGVIVEKIALPSSPHPVITQVISSKAKVRFIPREYALFASELKIKYLGNNMQRGM